MENNKTPSIRFKGFTDPWEQRKFGDTCKINGRIGFRGYTEKDIISKEAGGVLTFSPTNIVENKLTMECKNTYITRDKYEESPEIMVKNGDILFVKTGSTLGKSALVTRLEEDASINPQIVVMRVKEGTEAFMSNILITQGILKQVAAVRIGGAVPTMTETELKNFEYFAPTSDKEKMQIGTIFADIDHLITLHQRKYNKLLNVKKSMLEKMFPKNGSNIPEIRFKGFTDPWEQRKLEDFGKATGGTSIESEFSEDGIYKVISIGSYSENSVYNDQGIRAIKSDKTSNRILNRNDLTMILNDKTTSGNIIGRVLLIEESGIYVYNQRTERIEINLDEYDPVFLYEMLNAPNIREKIIKQAQGNTQIYVNWTGISLLEYMIPSKEEQVKIGEYLHSISNLITLHQRELEKLQNIKKSMLEKMFV